MAVLRARCAHPGAGGDGMSQTIFWDFVALAFVLGILIGFLVGVGVGTSATMSLYRGKR